MTQTFKILKSLLVFIVLVHLNHPPHVPLSDILLADRSAAIQKRIYSEIRSSKLPDYLQHVLPAPLSDELRRSEQRASSSLPETFPDDPEAIYELLFTSSAHRTATKNLVRKVDQIASEHHLFHRARDVIPLAGLLLAKINHVEDTRLQNAIQKYDLPTTPEQAHINRQIFQIALGHPAYELSTAQINQNLNEAYGSVRTVAFEPGTQQLSLSLPYEETIPPDQATEIFATALNEQVLPELNTDAWVIEVGAGSGAVSASVAEYSQEHAQQLHIVALDISAESAVTTRGNLLFRHPAPNRLAALESDMFGAIKEPTNNPWARHLQTMGDEQVLTLFNVPIMPVSKETLEAGMDAQKYANYDYAVQDGMDHSDGLGVFRRFLQENKIFFEYYFNGSGATAVVLPAFVGEDRIAATFEAHEYSAQKIHTARRKVRPGGFTWNQMELIEQISGYQFFDGNGTKFKNVAAAKASGVDIYFETQVYHAKTVAPTTPILDPVPGAQTRRAREKALHQAVTEGLTFEVRSRSSDDADEETKIYEIAGVQLTLPEPYYSEDHLLRPSDRYSPQKKLRFEILVREKGSHDTPRPYQVHSRTKGTEVIAPAVVTVNPDDPYEIQSIEISGRFLGEKANQEFHRRILHYLKEKGFKRYVAKTRLAPGKNYLRRTVGKWIREGRLEPGQGKTELRFNNQYYPAHRYPLGELISLLDRGFPRDDTENQEDLYVLDLETANFVTAEEAETADPLRQEREKWQQDLAGQSLAEMDGNSLHQWYLSQMRRLDEESNLPRRAIQQAISQRLQAANNQGEINNQIFVGYFFPYKDVWLPQFPSIFPEIQDGFTNIKFQTRFLNNPLWQILSTLKHPDKKLYLRTLGGAGAGKSTGAAELGRRFQNLGGMPSLVVSTDGYLLPRSVRRAGNLRGRDAYNAALMAQQMSEIDKNTNVSLPKYDMEAGQPVTGEAVNAAEIEVVILDDAFLASAIPEVEDRLDASIYFEDPDSIRFLRRLERDQRERGQSEDEILWTFAEAQITEMGPLERESIRKANIVIRVSSDKIYVRTELIPAFIHQRQEAVRQADLTRSDRQQTPADKAIYELHNHVVYAMPALLYDCFKAAFDILIKHEGDYRNALQEVLTLPSERLAPYTWSSTTTLAIGSIPPDSVVIPASDLMRFLAIRLFQEFPHRYRGHLDQSFHDLAAKELEASLEPGWDSTYNQMMLHAFHLTDTLDPMILLPIAHYQDDDASELPSELLIKGIATSLGHQHFYRSLLRAPGLLAKAQDAWADIEEVLLGKDPEFTAWHQAMEKAQPGFFKNLPKLYTELFAGTAIGQDEPLDAIRARRDQYFRFHQLFRDRVQTAAVSDILKRVVDYRRQAKKDAIEDVEAIIQLGLGESFGFSSADLVHIQKSELRAHTLVLNPFATEAQEPPVRVKQNVLDRIAHWTDLGAANRNGKTYGMLLFGRDGLITDFEEGFGGKDANPIPFNLPTFEAKVLSKLDDGHQLLGYFQNRPGVGHAETTESGIRPDWALNMRDSDIKGYYIRHGTDTFWLEEYGDRDDQQTLSERWYRYQKVTAEHPLPVSFMGSKIERGIGIGVHRMSFHYADDFLQADHFKRWKMIEEATHYKVEPVPASIEAVHSEMRAQNNGTDFVGTLDDYLPKAHIDDGFRLQNESDLLTLATFVKAHWYQELPRRGSQESNFQDLKEDYNPANVENPFHRSEIIFHAHDPATDPEIAVYGVNVYSQVGKREASETYVLVLRRYEDSSTTEAVAELVGGHSLGISDSDDGIVVSSHNIRNYRIQQGFFRRAVALLLDSHTITVWKSYYVEEITGGAIDAYDALGKDPRFTLYIREWNREETAYFELRRASESWRHIAEKIMAGQVENMSTPAGFIVDAKDLQELETEQLEELLLIVEQHKDIDLYIYNFRDVPLFRTEVRSLLNLDTKVHRLRSPDELPRSKELMIHLSDKIVPDAELIRRLTERQFDLLFYSEAGSLTWFLNWVESGRPEIPGIQPDEFGRYAITSDALATFRSEIRAAYVIAWSA